MEIKKKKLKITQKKREKSNPQNDERFKEIRKGYHLGRGVNLSLIIDKQTI